MATLREIQLCELSILKLIDTICNNNNLTYYISDGTLLGAVRHNGFIPWDDDADIMMPYRDMKKLKNIVNKHYSSDYFFDSVTNNPPIRNAWRLFGKIRKNGTIMKEPHEKDDTIHNLGIWVDVFPLIPLSKKQFLQNVQLKLFKVLRYWHSFFACTRKLNGKKIIDYKLFSIPLIIADSITWELLMLIGKNGDKYIRISVPVCSGLEVEKYDKIVHSKQLLQNVSRYKFEDTELCGVTDYDSFLKNLFGDNYMTPIKYAP